MFGIVSPMVSEEWNKKTTIKIRLYMKALKFFVTYFIPEWSQGEPKKVRAI